MNFQKKLWQGKVMTVQGLIPAEEMGITLPHEHLLITHQGQEVDLTDADLAVEELKFFHAAGGRTLVDMTNVGIKRDPLALRRISSLTGINIIMGSSYYKDEWLPTEVHEKTVEELTREIVRDIVEGVGETGIHSGVIGEVGVSDPITRTEEKVLKASARAQKETGSAINVHFEIGVDIGAYNYVLDILESEGANLRRVIVDHLVPRPDQLGLCQEVAQRGCYIEFDLFGHEVWPKVEAMIDTDTEEQIASVKDFIASGLLEHILISQDVCCKLNLTANGGYGYAHILKNVIPKFKRYGISEEEIQSIIVDNPKRAFPFQY